MRNQNPLLIVQIEPPQETNGGDYYYRTYAPGMAMSEAGAYVVNLTNIHRRKTEIMAAAGVLVLKNISDPDLLPLIIDRRSRGLVTVYEIADDLHAIPPWNHVSHFFQNPENLCVVCQTAQSCDAVQVSVPQLRDRYRCLRQSCAVFENQISYVPPARQRTTTENFVIGWGGSNGHLEDMAEIAVPLTKWITRTPNVRLHLMSSKAIWELFRTVPQVKKKYTSPGSINDYYEFLKEIDIGIAPLNDTPFNRSRSDVKFLEYAVSEVVPVMQHLEPYKQSVRPNKTGFLFTDANELIKVLTELTRKSTLVQKIARRARQYVLEERLQRNHVEDRLTYYENLRCNKPQITSVTPAGKLFSEWADLEGAVRRQRNLQLRATKYERLVYDGLLNLKKKDRNWNRQDLFRAASRLQPEQYLPFLFSSAAAHNPIVFLEKSLERNPLSLKSWVLLGEEFVKKGQVRDALTCFQRANEICPTYLIPLLKVHKVLLALGEEKQATNLLNRLRDQHAECLLNSLLDQQPGHCKVHPAALSQNVPAATRPAF